MPSAASRRSGSWCGWCEAPFQSRELRGTDMRNATPQASLPLAALLTLVPLAPALAHTGAGVSVGLESGFLHPITGLDHLVAMVAVGLWGAQLGNPAIWVLPITFPLVMALG